jgi:endogenous inhibitor of DNA gyrase (YacG/DUF329 family)
MTGKQKETIQALRVQGLSYSDIAAAVGVTKNAVKTYCWRNSLPACDASEDTGNKENKEFCRHCGKRLMQTDKQKPKVFCGDKCRHAWWNAHREQMNRKAVYRLTCAYCGTVFDSYGNRSRKYCSHACYINDRFGGRPADGKEGAPNDQRAI